MSTGMHGVYGTRWPSTVLIGLRSVSPTNRRHLHARPDAAASHPEASFSTYLIAWIAVGGQAWKAARVEPALVLKAE